MSLKSKIQALITAANAKTGETDATLTDAVQSLVDGYGGGDAPVINPLSITANGTYTAPSGVDGYSPVTVNVSGGGSDTPPHNLPAGYKEYLFLMSNGTQYIDTGVVFKVAPKVEAWVNILATAPLDSDRDSMGVSSTAEGGFIVNYGVNGIFYRYGKATSTAFNWINSPLKKEMFTSWRHIRFASKITVDFDFPFSVETNDATIGDFANNTQKFFMFKGRDGVVGMCFGATKIFDGDELVRHMIPCMRESDSVLGFYDLVDGLFYTNAGTGSFTGGMF